MRCINKKIRGVSAALFMTVLLSGCGQSAVLTNAYDFDNPAYGPSASSDAGEVLNPFAANLCVTAGDVDADIDMSQSESAGLFNINGQDVRYAKNVHEVLYPASITKIMTALIALEQGNLDDVVTVSENAVTLEAGAQKSGIKAGDQIVLRDLLYGMIMWSGNDAAKAVAEHIAGSEEEFANRMNQRARELGAVDTHFVNASGLHDDNHYSTVYDLYLIFQKVTQNETFLDMMQTKEYTATVTSADGSAREINWKNTNHYLTGDTTAPENVVVIGGKTGTTEKAQSCLTVLAQDASGNPYISTILKAKDRDALYAQMNNLLSIINN
ncbi:D-alanyl-D-alanine carboxypeptidase family protein [Diplocloster modestus]|uniref:Serine hydrolase n=1 Tax=Diplocloster modestus TaxID=2850322 RepID=A0ABS6KCK0_9FIRM|nr:serine hydrolase [Diplocloster modestus]